MIDDENNSKIKNRRTSKDEEQNEVQLKNWSFEFATDRMQYATEHRRRNAYALKRQKEMEREAKKERTINAHSHLLTGNSIEVQQTYGWNRRLIFFFVFFFFTFNFFFFLFFRLRVVVDALRALFSLLYRLLSFCLLRAIEKHIRIDAFVVCFLFRLNFVHSTTLWSSHGCGQFIVCSLSRLSVCVDIIFFDVTSPIKIISREQKSRRNRK